MHIFCVISVLSVRVCVHTLRNACVCVRVIFFLVVHSFILTNKCLFRTGARVWVFSHSHFPGLWFMVHGLQMSKNSSKCEISARNIRIKFTYVMIAITLFAYVSASVPVCKCECECVRMSLDTNAKFPCIFATHFGFLKNAKSNKRNKKSNMYVTVATMKHAQLWRLVPPSINSWATI